MEDLIVIYAIEH